MLKLAFDRSTCVLGCCKGGKNPSAPILCTYTGFLNPIQVRTVDVLRAVTLPGEHTYMALTSQL